MAGPYFVLSTHKNPKPQVSYCTLPSSNTKPAMFLENATPKSTISPRTRLQGGFIMDCDTAIDWASRILDDRLTMDEIGLVWEVIEDKVKVFGSRFSFVGPVLYAELMVVTRRATFPGGYLGMDPAEIPQFREGDREKVARKLLEEEGLGHLEFATRLD